tara:strand:- start:549 stop:1100 length:552 start_codon:yes stop_codon:yes gene_type:complete
MGKENKINQTGVPPRPSLWLCLGSAVIIVLIVFWWLMCVWLLLGEGEVGLFILMGAVGLIGTTIAALQYLAVFCERKEPAKYIGMVTILLSILGIFLVFEIGLFRWEDYFSASTDNQYLTVFMLVIVVLCLLSVGVATYRWGRVLDEYTITEPLCPHCDYNLRGTIASGRLECPECGKPFTIR